MYNKNSGYKSNCECNEILNTYSIDLKTKKKLPLKLQKIIDEGFQKQEGCIYFKKLVTPQSNILGDKTGNEGFTNLLYINDYVRSDISTKNLLINGISFVNKLAEILFTIDHHFIIICIIEKDDLTDGAANYFFKVTFHKFRKKDAPYYRISDTKGIGIFKISFDK